MFENKKLRISYEYMLEIQVTFVYFQPRLTGSLNLKKVRVI